MTEIWHNEPTLYKEANISFSYTVMPNMVEKGDLQGKFFLEI